ncbi:MAG: amino acid aminotransferase [Bacteroidetes bacterium]|nr:MAG: amino acid aminotransferase [Bacteroidota bacterium]
MTVYLNDRFVDEKDAKLAVSDLAIQRGYGVFDFFRTVVGRPLFLSDHLERFYHSAMAMGLSVEQEPAAMEALLLELLERSGLREAGVRLTLTGGYSADGFNIGTPNLILSCKPLHAAGEADFNRGIRIMSYAHQRELPQVKTINYQMAIWLQPLLWENKLDDVLYHRDGVVTEFPRANVCIVTPDQVLATPRENVLAGVTRKQVLALAPAVLPVEERPVLLEEVERAAEVFLTSTTRRLMPVLQVNGKTIGNGQPGPVTRALLERFLELEARQ